MQDTCFFPLGRVMMSKQSRSLLSLGFLERGADTSMRPLISLDLLLPAGLESTLATEERSSGGLFRPTEP